MSEIDGIFSMHKLVKKLRRACPYLGPLNPEILLETLLAIDKEAAEERAENLKIFDFKTPTILLATCICFILDYYINSSRLWSCIYWGHGLFSDMSTMEIKDFWQKSTFSPLKNRLTWALSWVLFFVIVPMLTIKLILRERLADYGLQIGKMRDHTGWYFFVAGLTITIFLILAFSRDDFANYYPFYKLTHRSYMDLILWELIYFTQFIGVEFFFRGFLINGLRPAFGSNAIFVMCVPYMVIHLSKPWIEASGSILFGVVLGLLALRSRSIWGGVAIHITSALCMDLAAISQGRGFPTNWWP